MSSQTAAVSGLREQFPIACMLWFGIRQRHLVATARKRLGLVSLCCNGRPPEAGDEVWVLFGCSMPMILRPGKTGQRQTQYSVIGPAYIPGLMQGEACRGLGPDGTPEEGYVGPMPTDIESI